MTQVIAAVDKLNNRLRKGLYFKIPYEIFMELTVDVEIIMGYALIT